MIDKSQIEIQKLEPQPNSDMQTIVIPSSPTIGNTNVVGSTVKEDKIFKDGYTFKVEVYDFNSPEIKREIEATHKEQQAILDRMKIDYDSLNKTCDI